MYKTICVIVWKMVKTAQRAGSCSEILGWRTSKEVATMANQNNTPQPVHSKTPAEIKKLEDQKALDRTANEAAEQAGNTERRYDQGHDIFTK